MSAERFAAASDMGRIAALAAAAGRDLRRCAESYDDLFGGKPFDPGFFGSLSLVGAFGSPWATVDELRIVNRAALWVFAVDWQIDVTATSAQDVDLIVRDCLAAADGTTEPATPLTRFLVDIRDELASVSAFGTARPIWRAQLERMLTAMAREWRWNDARESAGDEEEGASGPGGGRVLPDLEEYLANADGTGSSFVNVSHWIFTGDPRTVGLLDELMVVGAEVQRYLRLLNDLATYRRDVGWGDVNVLMLGVGRTEVSERMSVLADRAGELLESLRDACPRAVAYLECQVGFNTGFYGGADYWGEM
ncbi:terpene synthase [Microtetraspora sp. AC03309]|uniref:terpene synthase family protein n=1 Tax=Microtetraspora sp. AC03309 TaxID=2779376 RepID=UPI001E6427E1|nr:terpene synthase family protein [Microtetraspora sp. AC03309]MCC5577439.1 terpene synthase [Microtetraspora sp. AC03309]